MTEFIEFITAHWDSVVVILILVASVIIGTVKFLALSKEKKVEQIQGWLLQAVIKAESNFGSGTGKLKLSDVYDKFCERFPALAKALPFHVFSKYVDESLETMRELLAQNSAIASIVETEVKK